MLCTASGRRDMAGVMTGAPLPCFWPHLMKGLLNSVNLPVNRIGMAMLAGTVGVGFDWACFPLPARRTAASPA